MDSSQPILCGAEIHVGLGPHYPSQQVLVQIRKNEKMSVPSLTGEGINKYRQNICISNNIINIAHSQALEQYMRIYHYSINYHCIMSCFRNVFPVNNNVSNYRVYLVMPHSSHIVTHNNNNTFTTSLRIMLGQYKY